MGVPRVAVNDAVVARSPAVPVSRGQANMSPVASVVIRVPTAKDIDPPVAMCVTMEVVGHHQVGLLHLGLWNGLGWVDQVELGKIFLQHFR